VYLHRTSGPEDHAEAKVDSLHQYGYRAYRDRHWGQGTHVTAVFGAGDTFIWHNQVVWKDSDSTHCNFIGIQYIAYYLGAWVDEVA